jgi:hypothetical protein
MPRPIPTTAEYAALYTRYGDVEAFRAVAQEHGFDVAEELDRRRYRAILRAGRGELD